MKLVYKKNIIDRLEELLTNSRRPLNYVDYIEMTEKEYRELIEYNRDIIIYTDPREYGMIQTYNGIKINIKK